MFYFPEQLSVFKDTITAQEASSVLVNKVRFEGKDSLILEEFYSVYVAPSSWQAGFLDWSCACKGTQVVWECPDMSQHSWLLGEEASLHCQRSV